MAYHSVILENQHGDDGKEFAKFLQEKVYKNYINIKVEAAPVPGGYSIFAESEYFDSEEEFKDHLLWASMFFHYGKK